MNRIAVVALVFVLLTLCSAAPPSASMGDAPLPSASMGDAPFPSAPRADGSVSHPPESVDMASGVTVPEAIAEVLRERGIDPEEHIRRCLERRSRMEAFRDWDFGLKTLDGLLESVDRGLRSVGDADDTPYAGMLDSPTDSLGTRRERVLSLLSDLRERFLEERLPAETIARLNAFQRRFDTKSARIVAQAAVLLERLREVEELSGRHRTAAKKVAAEQTEVLRGSIAEVLPSPPPSILGTRDLPFSGASSDYLFDRFNDSATSNSSSTTGTTGAGQGPGSLLLDPVAADRVNTAETASTADLTALVASLGGNPRAIYRHVRDTIRTDFYSGLLRNAERTLHDGRGNDADQAALLIALFRIAGIPAHYVAGRISVDVQSLQDLTGTQTVGAAIGSLLDEGLDPRPVYRNGGLAAVSFNQIWVEAWLPYSDYRGLGIGEGLTGGSHDWISLAPSLKAVTRSGDMDMYDEIADRIAAWPNEYLSGQSGDWADQEPLGIWRSEIIATLEGLYPSLLYEDLFATETIVPDDLDVLPSSLPFPVVSVSDRFSVMPVQYCQTLTIVVGDRLAPSLSWQMPAYTVPGHRLTLRYEPATTADYAAVLAAGSLYLADPFLVEVVPILRIDGLVAAEGVIPVGMGTAEQLHIDIGTPSGTVRTDDIIVAGTFQAICGAVGRPLESDLTDMSPDPETQLSGLLHQIGLRFFGETADAADEIAGLLGVRIWPSSLSVILVQSHLSVTWFEDVPVSLDWQLFDVDANLLAWNAVAVAGDTGRTRAFRRLVGLQWSWNEQYAFADPSRTAMDSISAVTVIRTAAERNIDISTIDLATSHRLDDLELPPAIVASLTAAVFSGYTVTVPREEITVNDWRGTGWLIEDPADASQAAMLSGDLAGGTTSTLLIWYASYATSNAYVNMIVSAWQVVTLEVYPDNRFRPNIPYDAALLNAISLDGGITRTVVRTFPYYEGLDSILHHYSGGLRPYYLLTKQPKEYEYYSYYYGYPANLPEDDYRHMVSAHIDYWLLSPNSFIYTLGGYPNTSPRVEYNVVLEETARSAFPPGTYEFVPQDYCRIIMPNFNPIEKHDPWFVIFETEFLETPGHLMPVQVDPAATWPIRFRFNPSKVITRSGLSRPFVPKDYAIEIRDKNDELVYTVRKATIERNPATGEFLHHWDGFGNEGSMRGKWLTAEGSPYAIRVVVRKTDSSNEIIEFYSQKQPLYVLSGLQIVAPSRNSEWYIGQHENGNDGIPVSVLGMLVESDGTVVPVDPALVSWQVEPPPLKMGPVSVTGPGMFSRYIVPYLPSVHQITVSMPGGIGSDSISVTCKRPEFELIAVADGLQGESGRDRSPVITFRLDAAPEGAVLLTGLTIDGQYSPLSIDGQPVPKFPLPLTPGEHLAVFPLVTGWLPEPTALGQEKPLEHSISFTGQVRLCVPAMDCHPDVADFELQETYTIGNSPHYYVDIPDVATLYHADYRFLSTTDPDYNSTAGPHLQQVSEFSFMPLLNEVDVRHYLVEGFEYLGPADGELFTERPLLPPPPPNSTEAVSLDFLEEQAALQAAQQAALQFPYIAQFRMSYQIFNHHYWNTELFPFSPLDLQRFNQTPDATSFPERYALQFNDPELLAPGSYLFFPQCRTLWRNYLDSISDDQPDNDLEDPTRMIVYYRIDFPADFPEAFSPGLAWSAVGPVGDEPELVTKLLPIDVTLLPEFVTDRSGIRRPFFLDDVTLTIRDGNDTIIRQVHDITLRGGQNWTYFWDGKDENGVWVTPDIGPVSVSFEKEVTRQNPADGRERTVTHTTRRWVDILFPFDLPRPRKAGQTHIDGVNTDSRALEWTQELYTIKNQGPDIPLSISYHSLNLPDSQGPLGTSIWPDFDTRLIELYGRMENDDTEIVHVVRVYGLIDASFTIAADGTIVGEPGKYFHLIRSAGNWELIDTAGTVYTFVVNKDYATADLVEITDINGNTVSLSYGEGQKYGKDWQKHPYRPLEEIRTKALSVQVTSFGTERGPRISGLDLNPSVDVYSRKSWDFSYAGESLSSLKCPDNSSYSCELTASAFTITLPRVNVYIAPPSRTYQLVPSSYPVTGLSIVSIIDTETDDTIAFSGDDSHAVVTDARDKEWTYTHNEQGNVIATTSPEGIATATEWLYMEPVAFTDGRGTTTNWEYDARGNVIKTTFVLNGTSHVVRSSFNVVGLPRETIDSNGFKRTFLYDRHKPGNLIETAIEDNGGKDRYSFQHDNFGNIITRTDARGNTTAWQRDEFGFVSNTSVAGLQNAVTTHDAFGNLLTSTTTIDGNPVLMVYEYDPLDRLITVTRDDVVIARYEYDMAGNLIKSVDAVGHTVLFAYDNASREVTRTETIVNPDGAPQVAITHKTWDENGNLLSETNPNGLKKWYSYDDDSRLVTVEEVDDAGGLVVTDTFDRDENGNVKEHRDGNENLTTFDYDERDNLVLTNYADGGSERRQFDGEGNVVSETTPLGLLYENKYDKANRLEKQTRKGVTGFSRSRQPVETTDERVLTYDAAGNKNSETDFLGTPTRYGYDAANRLTRVTDVTGKAITLTLDDQGYVTEQTDQAGHITEYDINNQGKVITETRTLTNTDLDGRRTQMQSVTRYHYDDAGTLLTITDPLNYTTTFVNDSAGRTVKTIDPLNEVVERRTYKPDGSVWTITDRGGTTTTFTRGNRNRLIKKEIQPAGKAGDTFAFPGWSEEYVYDNNGNVVLIKDAMGHETSFEHDSRNRVERLIDPEKHEEVYSHDFEGNTVSRTDRRGHTTTYFRDDRGLASIITGPDNNSMFMSYNAEGQLVERQDRNGNVEISEYNELHQLSGVYVMDQARNTLIKLRTITYDAVGNVETETVATKTDPNGHMTVYERNEFGQVLSIDRGDQNSREVYRYNVKGERTETYRGSQLTIDAFDCLGRLTASTLTTPQTRDTGLTTRYEYDDAGNRSKIIPPKGESHATRYDFNPLRQIAGVTMPGDLTARYAYDRNGNLIERDLNGHRTSFLYTSRNQVQTQTQDGRQTSYKYDNNGNNTERIQPNGNVMTMTRDNLDRVEQMTWSLPTAKNVTDPYINAVSYDYDLNGNLTKTDATMANSGGQFTKITGYDWQNRPVLHQQDDDGIQRSYDLNGNLTAETTPDGRTTYYSYDNLDRLTFADTPEGTFAYTYHQFEQLKSLTRPDGTKTNWFYDNYGRIEIMSTIDTKTDSLLMSFVYTHDDNGNRTSQKVTRGTTEPVVTNYVYDEQDRLESFESRGRTVAYTYNPAGDRASVTITTANGNTTEEKMLYHYNERRQLVRIQDLTAPSEDVLFVYDDNGNMVSRTMGTITETFVQGPANQPLHVKRNGQSIETYIYDDIGMRMRKTETLTGQSNGYLYYGRRLIQEKDGQGATRKTYRHGLGTLGFVSRGMPQFMHLDHLSSVTGISSIGGNLLEYRAYEPFGGSTPETTVNETIDDAAIHCEGYDSQTLNVGTIIADGSPIAHTFSGVQTPSVDDPQNGWQPDIFLTVGEGESQVLVPAIQQPITLVTDLPPPYITVVADKHVVQPDDDSLVLTITVYPDPDEALTEATVTLPLKENVSVGPCDDCQYLTTTHMVIWDLGDILPAGPPITRTVTLSVPFLQHADTVLTNQATLHYTIIGQHTNTPSNISQTAVQSDGLVFFAEARITPDTTPIPISQAPANATIDYYCTLIFLSQSSTNTLSFIQKEFDSTHLAYFGARYYDPTSGRFTNPDPFMGYLDEPRSQFMYGYGYNNPLMYVDTDGESATAVCAVGGFLWGFGQMVYGMGKDIASGTGVRTTSEYLGLWGQNAVGGLEIGASIDVTLMSGGTAALMGSGALGLAGFEALTLSGEGDESLGTFAKKQALSGAIGAVGGPLLARGGALLGTMAYGGLTKTLGKKATTYAVSIAEKGLKRGSEFVARYAKALDKAVMDQFSRKAIEKTTSRFFPKPPAPRYRFNLNNTETTLSNTTISANTPKIIIADATKRPVPDSPYVTRIDPRFPGRPDPKYSIDTSIFKSGISTSKGGIRNAGEFWKKWAELHPESLSKSNKYLIENYDALKVSPRIDDEWIGVFPEHATYKDDVIIHHHVDFGQYAIPVPGGTHVGSGGPWHMK